MSFSRKDGLEQRMQEGADGAARRTDEADEGDKHTSGL